MKTHVGFALLLLPVLLGTEMGHGQSLREIFLRQLGNGIWWDSLSDDSKGTFVDGYITAMNRINFFTHSECMDNVKDTKPSDAEFMTKVKASMNLCAIAELFDFNVDKRKLESGIDEFYKDSLNTRIPIDYAMEYVRDKLKGKKSEKELADELTDWRKVVNK